MSTTRTHPPERPYQTLAEIGPGRRGAIGRVIGKSNNATARPGSESPARGGLRRPDRPRHVRVSGVRDPVAAGGRGRAPRRPEAQLARRPRRAGALLRARPAHSHKHGVLGLELDGARGPGPLRGRAHLAHAAVEPDALAHRPRAVERGGGRGTRDLERGSDAGSPGVSRMDLAGGGGLRGRPRPQRRERVHDRRDPPHPRVLHLELVHPGGVLLSHHHSRHRLRPAVSARPRERGDPGLLHAHRGGHVVHHAVSRHRLLRDPEGPGPAHLFLRARGARLLDEYPLLHPDRGPPLHLQPHRPGGCRPPRSCSAWG